MYPIAYIEFLENDAGEKWREGPRTESQEAAVMEKWKVFVVCFFIFLVYCSCLLTINSDEGKSKPRS